MAENNREKYAYLDRLSTRRLEELLLADAENASGPDASEAVLHILEVLQSREDGLAVEPLDVDRAWEEFCQLYNTPEGRDKALYPCEADRAEKPVPSVKNHTHLPTLWRTLRIAAATIALLLALMIGAQASGLNVFGALAQWTSETFHFGGRQGEIQSENYQLFLDELSKNQIPKEYAPTWIPSGFVADKPTVQHSDSAVSIKISFSDSDKNSFHIGIDHHTSQFELEVGAFEKDYISVESYVSHSKTFYIFSNIDSVTATWADGALMEKIWGHLSINDIKTIIDSIGGP